MVTLLDESAGILLGLNERREHARLVAQGKASGEEPEGVSPALFTTQLNTRFRRPVQTPGLVKVEAKIVEREGRAVRLEMEVRQWESKGGKDGMALGYGMGDGEEIVCALAKCEFKSPRTEKL